MNPFKKLYLQVCAVASPRLARRIEARALLQVAGRGSAANYAHAEGGLPQCVYEQINRLVPSPELPDQAMHRLDGSSELAEGDMPQQLKQLCNEVWPEGVPAGVPRHDHTPRLRSHLARKIAQGAHHHHRATTSV